MYYLEFYDRRSGVSLEDFHRVARDQMAEWTATHDDVLLLNIGRTWRMGPFAYLMVWPCDPPSRLDLWDILFTTGRVKDIEEPVTATMVTADAGLYEPLREVALPTSPGRFYVEVFRPGDDATKHYGSDDHEFEPVLVVERIGLFGPDPGGVAIFRLPNLSAALDMRETPAFVTAAGTYATIGSEVL